MSKKFASDKNFNRDFGNDVEKGNRALRRDRDLAKKRSEYRQSHRAWETDYDLEMAEVIEPVVVPQDEVFGLGGGALIYDTIERYAVDHLSLMNGYVVITTPCTSIHIDCDDNRLTEADMYSWATELWHLDGEWVLWFSFDPDERILGYYYILE